MALLIWLTLLSVLVVATVIARQRRRRMIVRIARSTDANELRKVNIDGHERSNVPTAEASAFIAFRRR